MEFTFEKLHVILFNFKLAIINILNTGCRCPKCFSLNMGMLSKYPKAKGRPLSTSVINEWKCMGA